MPHRLLIAYGKLDFLFAGAATTGFLSAVNVETWSTIILGLSVAIGLAITKLSPVIAQAIREIGPAIVEQKNKLAPFKAMVTENTSKIGDLESAVNRLQERNLDKDHLIEAYQAHVGDLTVQLVNLSLATAQDLGLIARNGPALSPIVEDGTAKGRVLVVEDDPTTARAIKGLLRYRGFDSFSVADADAAIAALAEGPMCVILDLMLHGDKGGGAVLKHIRDNGLPVRVIVQTGMVASERDQALGGLKPDVIIAKPFNYEELISAIRGH